MFLRVRPDGSFSVESADVCATADAFEIRMQDGRVLRLDRVELEAFLGHAAA